jgi:hypothetical protein
MGAGKPDWQKLHQLDKLPKEARANVPLLQELDNVNKRIKQIEEEVCEDCKEKIFGKKTADVTGAYEVKCEVEGCDYIAKGRSKAIATNNLRLHAKSHETTKNEQ